MRWLISGALVVMVVITGGQGAQAGAAARDVAVLNRLIDAAAPFGAPVARLDEGCRLSWTAMGLEDGVELRLTTVLDLSLVDWARAGPPVPGLDRVIALPLRDVAGRALEAATARMMAELKAGETRIKRQGLTGRARAEAKAALRRDVRDRLLSGAYGEILLHAYWRLWRAREGVWVMTEASVQLPPTIGVRPGRMEEAIATLERLAARCGG